MVGPTTLRATQHQLTVWQTSPLASKLPDPTDGSSWWTDQQINRQAHLQNRVLTPGLANPWPLYWWWTLDVTLGEKKKSHSWKKEINSVIASGTKQGHLAHFCFCVCVEKKMITAARRNVIGWLALFFLFYPSLSHAPQISEVFPSWSYDTVKTQIQVHAASFTFLSCSWFSSWKRWREGFYQEIRDGQTFPSW